MRMIFSLPNGIFFVNLHIKKLPMTKEIELHSCADLIDYVSSTGFLPLLDSGIRGYSAEELVDEDCRYVTLPGGGWDWPLWKWKGMVVREGNCAYGKFFNKKAGFISMDWFPDFLNYRRSACPGITEDSIEETILMVLREQGSMITRELRAACGFTGPKMRSKFDGFITRLQMSCHIVTEDFVYPVDRHNHEYGWGWSLLTTPEQLYGKERLMTDHSPSESFSLMFGHLKDELPEAEDAQINRLLK